MADHWLVTVINDIVAPLAPYPLLAGLGWWLWRQGRTQERLRNVEKSVRDVRRDVRDVRGEVRDVRGEVRELRGEFKEESRELRKEIRDSSLELRKDIRMLSRAMYQPPRTWVVDQYEGADEDMEDRPV